VPLYLGHHATGAIPTLRLIQKASIPNQRRVGGTPYRSGQHWLDVPQQRIIARQTDGILETLGFQILIEFRVGKGGISPKITPQVPTLIACHHWFQHRPPILGAMHVAVTQQGLLHIAKLIEAKQRVVAGAAEMSVVGSAFLVAVGLAH
jgi:hypothetical protein